MHKRKRSSYRVRTEPYCPIIICPSIVFVGRVQTKSHVIPPLYYRMKHNYRHVRSELPPVGSMDVVEFVPSSGHEMMMNGPPPMNVRSVGCPKRSLVYNMRREADTLRLTFNMYKRNYKHPDTQIPCSPGTKGLYR